MSDHVEDGHVQNHAQQAALDDILSQAEFDHRLFTLRAANPSLAYELDELARAFARTRARVAKFLFEEASPKTTTLDSPRF